MQLFLFDFFQSVTYMEHWPFRPHLGIYHSNLPLDCRSLTFNEDDKQMGINSCQSLASS